MSKIGNSDRPEIVVLQSNYIHNIFIAACLPQRLCDLVFYVEDLLHNKSFGFSLQNVILNGNMLPWSWWWKDFWGKVELLGVSFFIAINSSKCNETVMRTNNLENTQHICSSVRHNFSNFTFLIFWRKTLPRLLWYGIWLSVKMTGLWTTYVNQQEAWLTF